MRRILPSLLSILLLLTTFSAYSQRQLGMNKPNMNGPGGKPVEHVEGSYVQVNGINMYYEQYGDGAPLLMIHENGGSVETFNAQINFLSRKFRVIIPESRGQGRTNNNADSLTYELMAEDYYLFLEELNLDSVFVVGWSDGAIIGLLLARDYPGTVGKLVAVSPNLAADTTAVTGAYLKSLQQETAALRDSVAAGKKDFARDLMLHNLILHHPDIDASSLTDIAAPVLLVSGDHDIIKLEHTLDIYRHLKDAQLAIYPGTTHNVIEEAPQLFNNAVQRFFVRKNEMLGRQPNTVEPGGEE